MVHGGVLVGKTNVYLHIDEDSFSVYAVMPDKSTLECKYEIDASYRYKSSRKDLYCFYQVAAIFKKDFVLNTKSKHIYSLSKGCKKMDKDDLFGLCKNKLSETGASICLIEDRITPSTVHDQKMYEIAARITSKHGSCASAAL